ncbi:MAG: M15 family metallopeptidase [Tepidiformaceae bacterium]
MDTPRSRGTKPNGETSSRGVWNQLFIGALIAVALSFVLFVFVVADKFSGGGGSDPGIGAVTSPTQGTTPATGVTKTTTPTAGKTGTPAKPTTAPTGPAEQGEDTSPLVACGDILAPLDKQHRLPADCAPTDLVTLPAASSAEGTQEMRRDAESALEKMFAAAKNDGFTLVANSTYRSYQEQVSTFNYWVQTSGLEYAERTSARAGHSEHQLGTVADVGTPGVYLEDFTGTPAADWLKQHSWEYGFIISYPTPASEAITGYAYEPWHIRWLGTAKATDVHNSGLTLHEFLLK